MEGGRKKEVGGRKRVDNDVKRWWVLFLPHFYVSVGLFFGDTSCSWVSVSFTWFCTHTQGLLMPLELSTV